MLPAQPNKSLIDGMAVLQGITTAKGAVGVRELARELGLETTRVHRLLRTFVYLGMVERTAAGRYRPGSGIHVLAAQSLYGSGLIRRALPVLEQLSQHNCIVALGVLWRDHTSYLYHAQPHESPAEGLGGMGLYPATQSSVGLALLAERPTDEVASLFKDRTIPGFPDGLPAMNRSLAAIRRDGYALVNVDKKRSQRTLAVPVGQPAYAAVALAGRITDTDLPTLVEALSKAAKAINRHVEAPPSMRHQNDIDNAEGHTAAGIDMSPNGHVGNAAQ